MELHMIFFQSFFIINNLEYFFVDQMTSFEMIWQNITALWQYLSMPGMTCNQCGQIFLQEPHTDSSTEHW